MKSNYKLIISSVLIILIVGSVYISQLIFNEIAYTFNISNIEASSSFSLSCFCYAISFFIYGPLSDKLSAKRLVYLGMIGVIVCLIVSYFIKSYSFFLVIVSLIGFFAASVPAALFGYVAKSSSIEELPKNMGLMISASIIGIIFGRSFIAILTDYYNWKVSFLIYAIIIVISILFISKGINNEDREDSFNFNSIKEVYINSFNLLRNRVVFIYLLIGFLLFFVYLGISSCLTIYLKNEPFLFSAKELGWVNFAGISAVGGAFISSSLAKYISKLKILILFTIGVIAAVIILGTTSSVIGVVSGIFTLFIFVFGIQPIVISLINENLSLNTRGAASSMYLLSCLAGGSLGTYILGIVWSKFNWDVLILSCLFILVINIILSVINKKGESI